MLYSIVSSFFSFFSNIIPINKNVYIFGSWFGHKYSDNPKYFYLYLLDKHKDKKVFWYTRNKDLYYEMKNQELPVLYGYGVKVLWIHLRSAAVFCSCGIKKDILGEAINKKTKVFNLWHGTPMKKIGQDVLESGVGLEASLVEVPSNNFWRKVFKLTLAMPYKSLTRRDNYILSPSEEVGSILASAFKMNKDNVLNLGYPKLDNLFSKNKNKCVIILYAPTYRGKYDSEYDILTEFYFDSKKIDNWLIQNEYKLHIKLHPANTLPADLIEEINLSRNIMVIDCSDIYDVLGDYTYVITDFSSIYFDAMAIGVNAVLAPFGYKSYTSVDRQLYYDINDIFPYKLSFNWLELIDNFDKYRFLDNESLRYRFYKYLDSNSSQRLFVKVNQIVGVK